MRLPMACYESPEPNWHSSLPTMYCTPPSPSSSTTPHSALFLNTASNSTGIDIPHQAAQLPPDWSPEHRAPLSALSLLSRQQPPAKSRRPRILLARHFPNHHFNNQPTQPSHPSPSSNPATVLHTAHTVAPPTDQGFGGPPPMTENPIQSHMERHPVYGHMRVAPGPAPAGEELGSPSGRVVGPDDVDENAMGGPSGRQIYHPNSPLTGDEQQGSVRSQKNRSSPPADDQQTSHAGPARHSRRPYVAGGTPPTKGPAAGASSAALDHIPRAFVLQRLHELAPTFLSNPRTSDVRIVVPARPRPGSPDSRRTSATGPKTPESAAAAVDAQPIAPAASSVPARQYRLHRDYLVPQSSLFRVVLTEGLRPGAPELKGCRLLPFTSLHGPRPVYVPLPDPDSFDVLIQWMYYGNVEAIETALSNGQVSWRGLVANIQYLGMDDRTKRVVGGWWRRWARTEERERGNGGGGRKVAAEESDDEGEDEAGSPEDANGDTEDDPEDQDQNWRTVANGSGQPPDPTLPRQPLDPVTEEMSARLGGL